MDQILELFKVLGDETRFRIINLLLQQELCVCELVEILDLSQPKISKHIAKIRSANVVNTKRNEQYIYYSLNKEDKKLLRVITVIYENYGSQEIIRKDNEKLHSFESFVCKN